jgi:predicted nucleic acid-binding protein
VNFDYLDASAWVKRYYAEAGTRWVQELFRRQQAMACSSLGAIEVIATLARKRKAGAISQSEYDEKAQELADDWSKFVQIELTREVSERARDVAGSLAIRGADAVHLASALVLQSRLTDEDDRLTLITSDRELLEAARHSGLTVVDPQAQDPDPQAERTVT